MYYAEMNFIVISCEPGGIEHVADVLCPKEEYYAALAADMRCLIVPDQRMFDTPQHIPDGVTLVIKSLQEMEPADLMAACNAYW